MALARAFSPSYGMPAAGAAVRTSAAASWCTALGEAATLRHPRAFSAELGRMDPVLARTYPQPQHKFADLI